MRVLVRRYRWYVLALVVVLLLTVVEMRRRGGRPQVEVAQVIVGSLNLRIAASGLVEGESVDLGFAGQGRLEQLYVREGDRVSHHQLLARLTAGSALAAGLAEKIGGGTADVIQAPYDGTVVEIYQRAGALVGPGVPVLRVVSRHRPWVTAFIDSDDAAYLRPGQRLRCRAGGYLSQPWDLEIAAIGREAVARRDLPGSTRQVRVRCEPQDARFPLRPGTEVDIDGEVTIVDQGLLAPVAAIVHDGPHDGVWLVEKGRAWRRTVRLGPNNFDLIQIIEGLQAGEAVIVQGKEGLTEGQRVKVKRASPAS